MVIMRLVKDTYLASECLTDDIQTLFRTACGKMDALLGVNLEMYDFYHVGLRLQGLGPQPATGSMVLKDD